MLSKRDHFNEKKNSEKWSKLGHSTSEKNSVFKVVAVGLYGPYLLRIELSALKLSNLYRILCSLMEKIINVKTRDV